jgi:hypothetical protein
MVLKTPDDEVDEYLQVLIEIAEASGGGITDPPQAAGDCPDWEDNWVLDLAAAVRAFLVVSADVDLTSMSPWRGRPVIEPPQFASMVDASRRARRRRRRTTPPATRRCRTGLTGIAIAVIGDRVREACRDAERQLDLTGMGPAVAPGPLTRSVQTVGGWPAPTRKRLPA